MAPKNTTTPNMACAMTSSTEKRKWISPAKKIITETPFRTGHDGLGQAARLYVLEEVRPCARVLAQRGLELSRLPVAPGLPLHECRGKRAYQAQREAKEPKNIDTDGR